MSKLSAVCCHFTVRAPSEAGERLAGSRLCPPNPGAPPAASAPGRLTCAQKRFLLQRSAPQLHAQRACRRRRLVGNGSSRSLASTMAPVPSHLQGGPAAASS